MKSPLANGSSTAGADVPLPPAVAAQSSAVETTSNGGVKHRQATVEEVEDEGL